MADTPIGRRKYAAYLDWLQENESARKELKFDAMSTGWAVGSLDFKKALMVEHQEAAARLRQADSETVDLAEAIRQDALAAALQKIGKNREDLIRSAKSDPWKIALAASLKARTTATNRWLGENLNLGALHEVSRKLSEWSSRRLP